MTRDENTRFEELMALEFPDGLVPAERARPILDDPEPDPEPPELAVEGFRSWTPADEPDEPFVPPPAPPAKRWTTPGILGAVLVALPVLLMLVSVLGVRLPLFVSALAGIGFMVGVVLLLQRLRKRPPIDGDGAVL